jgi:hypothetical protein
MRFAPRFNLPLDRVISCRWKEILLIGVGVIALCAAHLTTLNCGEFDSDEITHVDYSVHGRLELWQTIIASDDKFAASLYGYGSNPIGNFLLRVLLHECGVHVWSCRIEFCLATLLGLLFFCRIAVSAFGAKAYWFLLVGLTQLFLT